MVFFRIEHELELTTLRGGLVLELTTLAGFTTKYLKDRHKNIFSSKMYLLFENLSRRLQNLNFNYLIIFYIGIKKTKFLLNLSQIFFVNPVT